MAKKKKIAYQTSPHSLTKEVASQQLVTATGASGINEQLLVQDKPATESGDDRAQLPVSAHHEVDRQAGNPHHVAG